MEDYVNMISQNACPKALNLNNIKKAMKDDAVILKVRDAVRSVSWQNFLRDANDWALWKVHDEFSTTQDGIFLQGHHLVIPASPTMARDTVAPWWGTKGS
ncbi:hypothetical protein NDU88_007438 [Pleurodeles waltl]|uniref:Uncharacterized protein n=1 Tax=Pleurodeles waltl TaxID=8319 RepID=A0AAV7QRW6_PLEWA|nr:hypothetical protein NDU88_007438 [Pleurodeles waltl]